MMPVPPVLQISNAVYGYSSCISFMSEETIDITDYDINTDLIAEAVKKATKEIEEDIIKNMMCGAINAFPQSIVPGEYYSDGRHKVRLVDGDDN